MFNISQKELKTSSAATIQRRIILNTIYTYSSQVNLIFSIFRIERKQFVLLNAWKG